MDSIFVLKIFIFSFIIGFLSDLVLNFLSKRKSVGKSLGSLRKYYQKHGVFLSALYAGITTGLVVILGTLIYTLFSFVVAKKWVSSQSKACVIIMLVLWLFLFGFLTDIILNKIKLFGNSLRSWYNTVGDYGSAVYGGLAITFAFSISFLLSKIIFP